MITPQEFAQELYKSELSSETKERIIQRMDKLSKEQIIDIHLILQKYRVKKERRLLQLEIELGKAIKEFTAGLNKLFGK